MPKRPPQSEQPRTYVERQPRRGPPSNPRPPQSEQPKTSVERQPGYKRGVDYQRIGNSSRFRNPERNMTVGTRSRTPFAASQFGGGEFNLKRAASKRLSRS